jgi:hypothetical protein
MSSANRAQVFGVGPFTQARTLKQFKPMLSHLTPIARSLSKKRIFEAGGDAWNGTVLRCRRAFSLYALRGNLEVFNMHACICSPVSNCRERRSALKANKELLAHIVPTTAT